MSRHQFPPKCRHFKEALPPPPSISNVHKSQEEDKGQSRAAPSYHWATRQGARLHMLYDVFYATARMLYDTQAQSNTAKTTRQELMVRANLNGSFQWIAWSRYKDLSHTITTITNPLAIDLSIRFNHYYHNSIIIDLLFGFSVSNLCYHLLQIHCPLKDNNAKNISILLWNTKIFFFRWGSFVARRPGQVILASLALSALSAIGLLNFK